MKLRILISLFALAFVSAPAFANEVAAENQKVASNAPAITPFNLVARSYQGSFGKQGIPSGGDFGDAALSGQISAQDLVKVAIAEGRLAPETINEQEYLSSVDFYLTHLDRE